MKRLGQIVFLAFIVFVWSFPIYLLRHSFIYLGTADLLFLIHRILGLYAFSLIVVQEILGSGRQLVSKLFPSEKVINVHMFEGKVIFILVLLHPTLLLGSYLAQHMLVQPFLIGTNQFYLTLGALGFVLLCLTVSAAVFSNWYGPRWINIHRINYLVFWIIFIHSISIGVDVQLPIAHYVYYFYGTIVALLTIRRAYILLWKK